MKFLRRNHPGYLKRAIGGQLLHCPDLAVCTRGKWKLNLVWKFKSNFDFGSVTEGQFSLKLDDPKSQIHKYANTHMTQGQFLQDGENVSFMSIFLSRASV